MREIRTSGLMSGEGKRGDWPSLKLPRPSSTLPYEIHIYAFSYLRAFIYPDSMRTREKCLAFGGGSDSDGRMIRGGFLSEEDRKALIALARAMVWRLVA